ncbi:MAG: NAD-dependent epimerase/dehydratase family protein [Proteobacteria bacterium]|nr:NAD-dependent epimerase/dehydratase family protein [Pseudomonadota bacterium]
MNVVESDIVEIGERLGDIAEIFSGKRMVLAGGSGFLGRYFRATIDHLNRHKLSKPCELVVIDNLITSSIDETIVSDHVSFRQADVAEPMDIDGPVDFVVNAAGIASPFYYRAYPLETLRAAVDGTRNLLELARAKGAKFTFFSSSEIYGDPDPKNVPTQESYRGNVACMGPRACYDESKRLGETLCFIYHGHHGLWTNTIRPFNVYGPGMQETDYRILPNFASNIKAGRTLKVYGDGKQTRTYCYVTDALNGFFRVIARGVAGEAYNIGTSGPEIGVVDLIKRIETVLDDAFPRDHVDYPDSYPADEPTRRCPDIRKARLQLGYAPQIELDDGLKRYFDWTDRTYTGAS